VAPRPCDGLIRTARVLVSAAEPATEAVALAPATARAYQRDWTAFRAWCRERGCSPLPAAPEDVATYLAALVADRSRTRGTLDRCLAAIGRAHRAEGHTWTAEHEALRAVLRAAPHGQRARQLTPAALGRLSAACGGDLAGLRDRALLLLHLAAGLRRGEVVGLDREHVSFTMAGLRLLLVPPEEGEGGEPPPAPVERVVSPGTDAATCPVRALWAWLDASACRHGPVFRKVDRWGHVEHERLHVDEVRRVLVRRASQAKLGLRKAQRLLQGRTASAGRRAAGAADGGPATSPGEG